MPSFDSDAVYVAKRSLVFSGVKYRPGDVIPSGVVEDLPPRSVLLEARLVVATYPGSSSRQAS